MSDQEIDESSASVVQADHQLPESIPQESSLDDPGMEGAWEHDKQPPMTSAIKVTYCPTCGLTPDFCEFGSNWEVCKQAALTIYPQYYKNFCNVAAPSVPASEPPVSSDAPAASATPAKQVDKPAAVKAKKGKKGAPTTSQVSIQRVSRAKHRVATVVIGLDLFDVKLDAAAKIFKKKFACGSSAVKGLPGQPDHVEVQGDFENDLDEIILQNYPQVPPDAIIHLKPK